MSGTGPVPAAHTTIPHAISSIGDTSSSMHSSTAPDSSSMHRRMTTRRGIGTSTTRAPGARRRARAGERLAQVGVNCGSSSSPPWTRTTRASACCG